MADESVGASALLDGGAPQRSVSVEQAWGRLDQMRHDPQIQAALARGDNELTAELRNLTAITRAPSGLQINASLAAELNNLGEISKATNGVSVSVAHDSSPEMRANVADTWLQFADLPPAVIEQVKNRTGVSIEEIRLAKAERSRLMADREFVKQYLDGHRAARTKLALVNIILSSPIK